MKSELDKKIKVFVVDDHPLVRKGLAQVINQEKDLVMHCEASDIPEAIACFKQQQPDFAILDISLKGGSGLELIKTLLSIDAALPILIVSMHDEFLYVERVLRSGARGYLMKEEATEKVVSAIRKILSGDVYVSDKMGDFLLNKLVHGRSFAKNGKKSQTEGVGGLSNRELEVLQLLGQGQGTRQIAEGLHVSVKTVESHYAKIKEKLHLKNAHELMQYAVRWHHSES